VLEFRPDKLTNVTPGATVPVGVVVFTGLVLEVDRKYWYPSLGALLGGVHKTRAELDVICAGGTVNAVGGRQLDTATLISSNCKLPLVALA
jgi:hypothetical protein